MTAGLQSQVARHESNNAPVQWGRAHLLHRGLRWWLILIVVWGISGIYEGRHLKRGWVPHDEGAFAQSADRVLHGELPHRDYTEVYTGGLSYLNAFAFRFLGESFATTRIVLFVFFLAWVPAVYWIASKLAPDWVAGGVTLLAVVWSLPNYSAAVPSWYNLFFATFGTAALFAYLEDRKWKWLFLAGLSGGLSFLVKTVALFYAAGIFLFLLYLEQSSGGESAADDKRSGAIYSAFVAGSLLVLLVGLLLLIQKRGSLQAYVSFIVPVFALVALLISREMRTRGHTSRGRFASLTRMLAPFSAGLGVPLAIFLIPYIRGHALGSLFQGIFVLPIIRVTGAFEAPPKLITALPELMLAGIVAASARVYGITRWLLTLGVAALFIYLLRTSTTNASHYQMVWNAAWWAIPTLVVFGAGTLGSRASERGDRADIPSQQVFLLLSVTALCSLVQFPFTSPIYFCYAAPLAILAVAVVFRFFPRIPSLLLAVLYVGFSAFAIFRVTPTFIYDMRTHFQPDTQTTRLNLPRAGNLRVSASFAAIYEKLIPLVQEHAKSGEIYAAPDCPEVYFLAGYKNSTPTLFDFFDKPDGRAERLLNLIDSRPIQVVVLNMDPGFSRMIDDDFYEALAERFPEKDTVGHFEVRWKR